MQKRNQTTHYFMLKIISHEFLFVIIFFFHAHSLFFVLFCFVCIHCLKIALSSSRARALSLSFSLLVSFNMFSLSFELIQSAEQQQRKIKQRSTQRREKSSAFVNGSCESVFIRKFSISISFHFVFDHENGTKYIPMCTHKK